MIAFARRNLKLYFREKSAVFFSLLAVFITIALYVLFLGNVYTKDISDSIAEGKKMSGAAQDTANEEEMDAAGEIMDNWVMAGVVAEAGITISLGVLGAVIDDRSKHITKDFYVSPIRRSAMTGGYVICAYAVTVLMTVVTFALAQAYIRINGGDFLALKKLPEAIGVILLTDFAAVGLMAFFVSLFQTQSAYRTASTVIGTLVGFVMGIYLPIGMYPSAVQWIIRCFPISHGALLLRSILTEEVMERSFAPAPAPVMEEVREFFGITCQFGSYTADKMFSVIILFATGAVFLGLACVNLSGKQK